MSHYLWVPPHLLFVFLFFLRSFTVLGRLKITAAGAFIIICLLYSVFANTAALIPLFVISSFRCLDTQHSSSSLSPLALSNYGTSTDRVLLGRLVYIGTPSSTMDDYACNCTTLSQEQQVYTGDGPWYTNHFP